MSESRTNESRTLQEGHTGKKGSKPEEPARRKGAGPPPNPLQPPMSYSVPRGGKREGAGRKPREVPREAITIRLEPETATKFKKICKASKRSQSEQVTEWVDREQLP